MFKHWQPFLFGLFAGLLSSGVILLLSRPPSGVPVQLEPPPTVAPTATPLPLRVHVAGAVNAPGVYELPAGSILADALSAAGGVAPEGNTARLNLAQLLTDGTQIFIASDGGDAGGADPATARASSVSGSGAGGRININTASAVELESLPGIGPSLAGRIVDYRDEYGLFDTVDDLTNVRGIGAATLESIRDLVTVGP